MEVHLLSTYAMYVHPPPAILVAMSSKSHHYLVPRCMLTIQNNDVTRVRADVDSLMFQSMVSPKMAVR